MRKSALSWIGHPLTIAAVAVLLLNDHVLKAAWPGAVTGKLSDFAGLVVAPPLLNLVLRRPWVSVLVTGVAFTLVKTTAAGAAFASEGWTLVWGPSQVLADPTDLLALPALYGAWWIWNHPGPGAERLARVVVVIPCTVLAVAATSGPGVFRPYSAFAVAVADERIVVAVRGGVGYGHSVQGFVSEDGGRSWRDWGVPLMPARTSACVPDRCYRIVPGRLKVEESRNGRWVTSWEVSPGDQGRLAVAYPPERPEDVEAVESLAVAVQQVSGGHLVVVANGADGIALRDVSGVWRRLGWAGVGFDAAKAAPLSAPGRYDDFIPAAALLAALAAGLVTLLFGVRRLDFAAAGLLTWVGVWLFRRGAEAERVPLLYMSGPEKLVDPALMLLGMGMVPAGLAGVIVVGMRHGTPYRVWVIGVGTAAGAYLAIMLPFYLWSAGWLDGFALATGLSICLGVAVVGAGLMGSRLVRRL
ncbi:hypothetical protein [Acrocarpospora corrugata]|nr:hypothetical protein [Acrocarpospora corrugata]